MRCPFCEGVHDTPDSEPSEVAEHLETCLVEKVVDIYDGSDTYNFVCDLTEFQCRDCGKSFWV